MLETLHIVLFLHLNSVEVVSGQPTEGTRWPRRKQAADRECCDRLCEAVQSQYVHQLGGQLCHLPASPVHGGRSEGNLLFTSLLRT